MKLGLQLPYFTYPGGAATIGDTLKRIAQDAEAAGLSSFWVMDHFFQLRGWGPKEREMLEGYGALSFAAAATSKIKLDTLVTSITYRHPAILIKTATTLDVLSGGRAYFGVGAAWYDVEHTGLGVPFPPLKERFELLEETLQLAHRMWREEVAPFESKHLNLAETLNSPNSIQRPLPPIMIGGSGEQKTFRLIAKYADACNIIIITGHGVDPMEGVKRGAQKLAVLRERCDEIGRPWSDIEKTTLSGLIVSRDGKEPAEAVQRPEAQAVMTPGQAIEYFHALAEIGVDHAIFNTAVAHVPGALDIWAEEVVPAVEKLVPSVR
jgi:F420-dependent oxidoreductase-like protein